MQSAAYRRYFSDSITTSPLSRHSNVQYWNFVSNNIVRLFFAHTHGTNGGDADLSLRPGRIRLPPFSAIDYRRYAAECVRLAQRIEDPDDKARMLDMAETFRELADKNDAKHAGSKE